MKTIDIDLAYLIFAYQDDSPENIYYLDTEFGDIQLVNCQLHDLRDLTDEIELSSDRFLYVPKAKQEKLLANLKQFAEGIDSVELRKVLAVAFESPHVLAAFKKILEPQPHIYNQLETYLHEQTRSEVLSWLAINDLAPSSLAAQDFNKQ